MRVMVEATGELERRLTITLPFGDFESKVQERLKSIASRVKLDGFRPGKIPHKVLEHRYGSTVRQEIVDEFIRNSLSDAIKQESLQLASSPQINKLSKLETDKPFEYTATFEILPDIESINLEGIKIKRPIAEVTDIDVKNVLEKIRSQHLEWKSVDRPAQEGDGITITYHGTINGESFQGGHRENFFTTLGEKSMIDGFEEHLIGAQKDEALAFEVYFPDNYTHQELAGKKVNFDVKIISIAVPHLPEINNDFVEKLGIKDGGIETLLQEVRSSMVQNLKQSTHTYIREQVMDALLAVNRITLPSSLVENEIGLLLERAKVNLNKQGIRVKDFSLDRDQLRGQACKRVALSLILGAITEKQGFKISAEKIRQKATELTADYENQEEIIRYVTNNREKLSEIEGILLEEKIISWVLDQVEILDEVMDFEDVVNSRFLSIEEKNPS
ncbi:trigger factor [Candidatus Nitrosoglobus terrae]|uniref:Trigger factor n=1 Tax=Candidatus Nitrosoglobus terrae TaxID=1630141 RepID=A0A1Q2SMU2_9GAMM|nr:trigger factor [Candidatus Nitrosoglobus terrae]BAW80427.1 trigger factor [Candidatus Nitrosoglobus terrae]